MPVVPQPVNKVVSASVDVRSNLVFMRIICFGSSGEKLFVLSGAKAEVRGGFQPALEGAAARAGFLLGIKLFHEFKKTALQFRDAHVFGRDIDVEQRAKL